MRTLDQNTARDVLVFMVDSVDDITGKTGLTLTITASKAAAAFASITPTVTERGNGWYQLALTASHTDTLGDFALHITGAGANASDILMQVTEPLATATNLAAAKSVIDNIYADTAGLVVTAMDASSTKLAAIWKRAWHG